MIKKTLAAVVAFSLLTSMYVASVRPVNAEARSDINVTFYSDADAAWTALVNNQADFIQWALTKTQKEAAETNPSIQLAKSDELNLYEFDLNNNYTIKSYPGVRSATNSLRVRQAITRLVDKDYITTSILQSFGARTDVPMPVASQSAWIDPSVIGINYPYPYDPEAAAALLAAEGFTDIDGNGWLNYPADWPGAPGADTTQYPLVTCVRTDQAYRQGAGQYLINQLEITLKSTSIAAGFKTTGIQWHRDSRILNWKVMYDRDYQIYTGGWSLSRFPAYLFYLFNSGFWYPYGWNYVTGMNSSGLPNYPDMDELSADVFFANSFDAAQTAAQAFTVAWMSHVPNIPLWSTSSYWAYRKELVGVVNMNGYGTENDYTFLNAYKTTGDSIRLAAVGGPDRLNILWSSWYFEHAFLSRLYYSGIGIQPYDLSQDAPYAFQDWSVGTYDDNGVTKSVVTYYLRKDVGIVAPVTGAFVRNFDADDLLFSAWYTYAFPDAWNWASYMDLRYAKAVDLNGDGWKEVQFYFDDDMSYWFYANPTWPLLTRDELIGPLCGSKTETWSQMGTTPFLLNQSVVEVTSATLNGIPLVEGVDFQINAGYALASHKEFFPLRDLTGTISITYEYADISSTGYFLGGLPWQQVSYSMGAHYPVSMTAAQPGVGDSIVLGRNTRFFLETPFLGEIDWSWKWVGTTKPRNGNYKIDIFDVVRATGAYCTRGDGTFNPKFFPGADIDPTDLCHIGIFDLVTITSSYGKTFGTPPP